MKELTQSIRATADLVRHKVGVFLRSHDPDLANVTGTEPTFEEMETFLTHLAEVPESTDNEDVLRWVHGELGDLEVWQVKLIIMWYGEQIIVKPNGRVMEVSLEGSNRIEVDEIL